MIKKRYLKFSFLLCFGAGIVFSIFSIVFYFGEWDRALVVFFMGLFIGALAIPEFEPKAVNSPTLFQTIVGTIGGALAAVAFKAGTEHIISASIIGAFVGFTASFWVKHIQIP